MRAIDEKVLRQLRSGAASKGAIASVTKVKPAEVSRALRRLEDKGLVQHTTEGGVLVYELTK